jgi:hypothetical protein
MKKAFRLEGSQIKLREVKDLVGQARYEHIIREAWKTFLQDPVTEIAFMTHRGILVVEFRID